MNRTPDEHGHIGELGDHRTPPHRGDDREAGSGDPGDASDERSESATSGVEAGSWFGDESALLAELRVARGSPHARSAVPTIDGYDDLVELARGGQGIVYLATQRSTRRRVAIKVLRRRGDDASGAERHGETGPGGEALRRFEREIDLVASLRHPNIVRVYDSGRSAPPDSSPFLVMEHLPGMPLDEHVRTHLPGVNPSTERGTAALRRGSNHRADRTDLHSLIALFVVICDAVNFAHRRGIIHRDLKPSNIRVDVEGVPHVLDFGMAKWDRSLLDVGAAVDDPRAAATITEASGAFMGSLPWASPEQVEGNLDQVDLRSDLYALGAILYQLTTGRTPTDMTGGLRRVLDRIVNERPPPPRSLNPAIDDDLETILLACLEKDPERRYQTAGALADDLRHWGAGEPIAARRESAWGSMRRAVRRHRRASALLLAGFAVTAILAAVAVAQAARARAQQRIAEARFEDVRELANTFLFEFHDAVAPLPGSQAARELVVSTALRYLDRLAADDAISGGRLTIDRARAYHRVGDIQGNPYKQNVGDLAGARRSYETALALVESLLAQQPEDREARRVAADLELAMADLLLFLGDREGSLARLERGRSTLLSLREQAPEDLAVQRLLGASFVKRGDALVNQGRNADALAEYGAARRLFASLVENGDPAVESDRANLAVCFSKLGLVLRATGDAAGALMQYEQALAISKAFAASAPLDGMKARSLEINHNQVGEALTALDRLDDALPHHEAALTIAERLAAADPRDRLARSDLTYTLNRIGELHVLRRDHAAALPLFERALELRAAASDASPENASLRRDLCVSLWKVAEVSKQLAETTDPEQLIARAESLLRRCLAEVERMQRDGTLNEVDEAWPDLVRKELDEVVVEREAAEGGEP